MANLIMTAPIVPAALTTSRGSGAENLLTANPKEVWLDSAAGSAATIDIDLGAVSPIDTVFLGHIYLAHTDAQWSISGGLAGHGEFAVMADSALRAIDSPGQAPRLSNALWHGAATNLRYLRISVTQKAGESPISIGCQVIGKAFTPQYNMAWGAGRKVIDTGTATPLPDGGFAVVEGVRKGAFECTLQDLSSEETEQLYILQLICGSTKPLLVVEDPEASVGQGYRTHYCKLVNLKPYERRNAAQTRWDLSVEDWGAIEASTGGGGIESVDETPDAFSFTDVTDADLATQYPSNLITVSGLGSGVSVDVSVAGASYSKNGGAYTTSPGTATNGDTFRVRHTSSAEYETATNTTLTIGGVSDTFTTTTKAEPATAPSNSVAPAITGTFTEGQTLSVSNGTWTGTAPITYAYQWTRDGADIPGADTATYALVSADVGAELDCNVTATNAVGSTPVSATGEGTVAAAPTAPSNSVAPAITGTFTEGQTLSVSNGTWTGTAPITYAYQWTRDGADIPGADTATYALVSADVGAVIDCNVTATNAVGSTPVSATGEGTVAAAPAASSLTYTDSVKDAADLDLYTFPSLSIGAEAPTRLVAVCLAWRTAGTSREVTSVTVGGVSATQVVISANTGGGNTSTSEIWVAAVPTGTTADVVVTLTGVIVRLGVALYRLEGVASPTPDVTMTSYGGDITINPANPSHVIASLFIGAAPAGISTASDDVPAGSLAISATLGGANTTTWTGLTEDVDLEIEGTNGAFSALVVAAWDVVS